MATANRFKITLAESFREPDDAFFSPRKVGDALQISIHSLAERAGVGRNTPSASPRNERLQSYLRDVVRVLCAAVLAAGDNKRAIFWFMNEPLSDFDFKTPDDLVRAGKAQVVLDYIDSISGGASG